MARSRSTRRRDDARDLAGPVLSSSSIVGAGPAARRNLIVEGSIVAEVPLHAHGVSIGPTGRVEGDVFAAVIRVEGEVIGDLRAEAEVRVCRRASVLGDITAPDVIVEEGARFKGRILMQAPEPLAAETGGRERAAGLTA